MPRAASAPACAQDRAAWPLYVSDSCVLPRILLVRHSFSTSEGLVLLRHVMVVNLEYRMLRQFEASHLGTKNFARTKRRIMSARRRLRNFWIPWVAMIVLGCFSDALAQTTYKVTDLGSEGNEILGCAMSLNNEGWTEVMAQNLPPGQQDNLGGTLLSGRLFLDIA